MGIKAGPGERYTIRRKVFKLFGAGFQIFDETGGPVAYTHQKAFRLREDITLYTDETKSDAVLKITTQSVLDFSGTYDVQTPDGMRIRSLRRKGLKSTMVRDEWLVYDRDQNEHALIRERGGFAPIARRFVDNISFLLPQTFDVIRQGDGVEIAAFRQHFNPFIYRLGVAIKADDEHLDDLLLLAAASLIAAIEGRQD